MQSPVSLPAPLPKLGPAASYREEFALAGQLIAHARRAFVDRPETYRRTLDDKFIDLALGLGASAVTACERLAEHDAYWCCVCARPYLEFALRLLWASRESDGIARMYSYYAKLHRDWWEKLAKANPEHKGLLDEADAAAPLSKLPESKMPNMRQLIEQIGAKDQSEKVPTLYAEPDDYDGTVGLLHHFLHANPLMLGKASGDNLQAAAHAVVNATNAMLRAVGYRMGWEQASVVHLTLRIGSLQSLTPAEKEAIRKSLESGCNLPPGEPERDGEPLSDQQR